MACNTIQKGRLEPCKDSLGGIQKVYLGAFDATFKEAAAPLLDGRGEQTSTFSSADIAEFELRADGNTFEEAGETNDQNGTSIVTQTLTLRLKKQSADSIEELNKLAKTFAFAIVEDMNGQRKIAGIYRGLSTSITASSGGAMGDFNGYNLVLSGISTGLAPELNATAFGGFNLLTDFITV